MARDGDSAARAQGQGMSQFFHDDVQAERQVKFDGPMLATAMPGAVAWTRCPAVRLRAGSAFRFGSCQRRHAVGRHTMVGDGRRDGGNSAAHDRTCDLGGASATSPGCGQEGSPPVARTWRPGPARNGDRRLTHGRAAAGPGAMATRCAGRGRPGVSGGHSGAPMVVGGPVSRSNGGAGRRHCAHDGERAARAGGRADTCADYVDRRHTRLLGAADCRQAGRGAGAGEPNSADGGRTWRICGRLCRVLWGRSRRYALHADRAPAGAIRGTSGRASGCATVNEDRSEIARHLELAAMWGAPAALARLYTVDHSDVGKRFIIASLIFFLVGGVLAMMIRTQLAAPDNAFMEGGVYSQVFTMHGTIMMFLFAIPMLEGFSFYLLPKMLGARDMAYPRLGAFAWYCYLFGATMVVLSLVLGLAPRSGWFMYVPLSSGRYSPDIANDIWLI